MKSMTILALAASLSGCAPPAIDGGARLRRTDAALAQVEAGFDAARAIAALFAPWIAPAQAARIDRLGQMAAAAIESARHAADLAARRAALRRAEAAARDYRAAAGG